MLNSNFDAQLVPLLAQLAVFLGHLLVLWGKSKLNK